MLVGDSMNRNQFESMLCLLQVGLQDKRRMYEIHGHKITKGRGYFVFKFKVSLKFCVGQFSRFQLHMVCNIILLKSGS